MDHCYVEFVPKDAESLRRTDALFQAIGAAKESGMRPEDAVLTGYLNDEERACFWNPSPDEEREWNAHWSSTPVDVRLSPDMVTPGWHFGSMLDAFWNGEYELVAIQEENGRHYLTFDPFAYPYGGTGCMVALLECFGHTVTGIEDGTGYRKYTRRNEVWRPKAGRRGGESMTPQNKTLALFAVVGYVVSFLLSGALWGMGRGAWLPLLALVPCVIALAWVKLFFLHPRLQGVPGFLRGGGVALLSYVSFGVLMSAFLALRSDISDLRETLWYFLVAGTAMFGLPLVLIGAVTGLIADKRFGAR